MLRERAGEGGSLLVVVFLGGDYVQCNKPFYYQENLATQPAEPEQSFHLFGP